MCLRSFYMLRGIFKPQLLRNQSQVKRNGDVVMYDANQRIETVKIRNNVPAARPLEPTNATNNGDAAIGEYQLFVNRREEICVMQSSADVDCGRYSKVCRV